MICTAGLFLTAVTRTHVFVPGAAAIRPGLIFAILALLAWMANNGGIRSLRHLKHPLGYLALFILVWAGMGILPALYPGWAFRYFVNDFARVMVLFMLVAAVVRNMHDVRRLLLLYAIGAIAYGVFATVPGMSRGIGAGGYDPNDSAMLIVSALPLILYFLVRSRGVVAKGLLAVGFFTCCGAIVTSGSRGGFLALLALVLYIVFFYKALTPIIRLSIVAMLAGGLLATATGDYWERMQSITDEDDYNLHSIAGRKQLWSRGVGYMAYNPVLGVGLHNFSVAEGLHPTIVASIESGYGVKYGVAHSMWVETGAELGLPGFVAFVAMFVLSIRYLLRYARLGRRSRAPPDLRDASVIAGALIGVLVALAVAGTFLSQQYHGLIWGPLGLVLAFLKVAPPLATGGAIRKGGPATARTGRHMPSGSSR